jgi:hypothetical protein
MSNGKRESKTAERREHWGRVIGEQEASGQNIRFFCRQHQVPEHSFYMWRKALRQESPPVRFALVETTKLASQPNPAALELVFGSGHILRIGPGVDAATLRTVVEALSAEA